MVNFNISGGRGVRFGQKSSEDRGLPGRKSHFMGLLERVFGGKWGLDPGKYDPDFVRDTLRRLSYLYGPGRYFRIEVEGWENLPPPPALIVSNHSGGAAAPDVWGFLVGWHSKFNAERPIHALAHEIVMSIWPTGFPFEKLGVLRADPEIAHRVFREWKRDIFVMPGGDVDVFRPYKKRYQVCFAGRKGYVKLALSCGVPIVPVANDGAHSTLVVLTDGRKIAEKLRLKKIFRLNVFPIHLSLPWGLAIGPLPHIPPPATLRYKIGEPIYTPDLDLQPGETPPRELIEEYDRYTRERIQGLLDQFRRERERRSFFRRLLSKKGDGID